MYLSPDAISAERQPGGGEQEADGAAESADGSELRAPGQHPGDQGDAPRGAETTRVRLALCITIIIHT